jgi:hypothetical protein
MGVGPGGNPEAWIALLAITISNKGFQGEKYMILLVNQALQACWSFFSN